jgi:phospholipid/cholesterol/gamma-HCH transport system ATP-binding protein
MITVTNLKKSFGDKEVLKGISTVFHAGKTNLIIGTSGSGKTVFIKNLVGLFQPTSGSIMYDDIEFTQLSHKEKKQIRMQIGMLFQGSALFDSMTVEENVLFPLDMFTNMTRKEKLNQVNSCLERVNLHGANDKYPGEISGGMMKRVGIARAIVLNPKYLFCDEPNSGLDPKTSLVIDELLTTITHEFNITTIINTHDMNSVIGMGEKVIFLHQGYKEWEGSSTEILQSDNQVLNDFIFPSDFLKGLRKGAEQNLMNKK